MKPGTDSKSVVVVNSSMSIISLVISVILDYRRTGPLKVLLLPFLLIVNISDFITTNRVSNPNSSKSRPNNSILKHHFTELSKIEFCFSSWDYPFSV